MLKTKNIERLSKLISASNINEKTFLKLIDNLKIQERIVIYGAGNWGRWLLRVLKNYSVNNVYAFLDLKAEMIGNIDGISVFKPDCDNFLQQENTLKQE